MNGKFNKIMQTIMRLPSFRVERKTSVSGEAIYLIDSEKEIKQSFWKDLPLTNNDFETVNALFEIPRGTISKIQIFNEELHHPLKQDSRKLRGMLLPRYFQMPVLFNYGALPRTWEGNILHKPMNQGLEADDDPIDVIEFSNKKFNTHLPIECVVIGALGLIDQGEMDWKILILNKEDAIRTNTFTLKDALMNFHSVLEYIRTFFKVYKVHEGKGLNEYIEDGRFYNEIEAIEIIKENNKEFEMLVSESEHILAAKKRKLI